MQSWETGIARIIEPGAPCSGFAQDPFHQVHVDLERLRLLLARFLLLLRWLRTGDQVGSNEAIAISGAVPPGTNRPGAVASAAGCISKPAPAVRRPTAIVDRRNRFEWS